MAKLSFFIYLFTLLSSLYGFSDDRIKKLCLENKETFIEMRHHLHEIPETMYDLPKTSSYIAQKLKDFGHTDDEIQTGVGKSGVVALLKTAKANEGKVLALRADMDALPLQEMGEHSYKSKHPGMTHACGHDGHMANLLVMAKILKELSPELSGQVKFIFQPAEEGGAGAYAMIEDGVLENPHVDAILAFHNWPVELGQITTKAGPFLAAADYFKLVLEGSGGGHGATSFGNPIVYAAQMIMEFKRLEKEYNDSHPNDPIVLSLGMVHAGTACNITPDSLLLEGTLRSFSESAREFILKEMKTIIQKATPSPFQFTYNGYPVTNNHPEMVDLILNMAKEILGASHVSLLEKPLTPSEDFSFYLQKVPGAMFLVGSGSDNERLNHRGEFDFNDDSYLFACQVMLKTTLHFLEK